MKTAIVAALEAGPKTLRELEAALDVDTHTAAFALRRLSLAGVVQMRGRRRDGQWRLTPTRESSADASVIEGPRPQPWTDGPVADVDAGDLDDGPDGLTSFQVGAALQEMEHDEQRDQASDDDEDDVAIDDLEDDPAAGGQDSAEIDRILADVGPVPPLRAKHHPKPAHRQPGIKKTEKVSGESWWLDKDRDALNKEATDRAPRMRGPSAASGVGADFRENWTQRPSRDRGDEPRPRREC